MCGAGCRMGSQLGDDDMRWMLVDVEWMVVDGQCRRPDRESAGR